jgi:glycosyltransferase involved in cell wall biosynthesis
VGKVERCQTSIGTELNARPFAGLVVVHAAVNGGMITNFGRIFARRLSEGGAELHFFVSKYPVFGWPPPVADLESLGGKYHGLPLPEHLAPLHELWTILLMTFKLRRAKADVLHTRGSVMGFVGRVAGRLAGVPVIVHHQDDLVCRDEGLTPCRKKVVAAVEKTLSRLSHRSLFVSQAVMGVAMEIGFRPGDCVLVGNDLSENFQAAAVGDPPSPVPMLSKLRKLGVPEGAKVVGCVGRLAHLKGIDLLIEAAGRVLPAFPEWVVVIKGDGPLRETYQKAIQSKGLGGRVFLMTEELTLEDLPALYRCFDLFALPTRREGFGMVFAEAMAMGLPVVLPEIMPVTEAVPEGCGMRFKPEGAEDLARALGQLMENGVIRADLAARGKAHALATWCGHHTGAEKVLLTYREILMEKGIRPHIGPRAYPGRSERQ